MRGVLEPAPKLRKPGLFITATDTGVGKTTVACAIAAALRGRLPEVRVGVCKPFGTGCRHDREGLVSPDAEALAHFADCRQPLEVICPVRFGAPLAPAVAAATGHVPLRADQVEKARREMDLTRVTQSLERLDEWADVMLVEGIGGVLVPLAPEAPRAGHAPRYQTVLDLAAQLGYPVVVVARAGLGTLNHTAMTVRILRQGGCRVAGIVINGYEADVARSADPAMAVNRQWLEKLTGVPVLATVPRCEAALVAPERGRLPADILTPVAAVDWMAVAGRAGKGQSFV